MANETPVILYVEDNIHDAELTIRAFKKTELNPKIIHLNNGEEALEYLFVKNMTDGKLSCSKPHVILLDLKMPKVTGVEVLRKIKKTKATRCIPVVMLTSSNEDKDVSDCYDLGANSYIVKPMAFDGFNQMVKDFGVYWFKLNRRPA